MDKFVVKFANSEKKFGFTTNGVHFFIYGASPKAGDVIFGDAEDGKKGKTLGRRWWTSEQSAKLEAQRKELEDHWARVEEAKVAEAKALAEAKPIIEFMKEFNHKLEKSAIGQPLNWYYYKPASFRLEFSITGEVGVAAGSSEPLGRMKQHAKVLAGDKTTRSYGWKRPFRDEVFSFLDGMPDLDTELAEVSRAIDMLKFEDAAEKYANETYHFDMADCPVKCSLKRGRSLLAVSCRCMRAGKEQRKGHLVYECDTEGLYREVALTDGWKDDLAKAVQELGQRTPVRFVRSENGGEYESNDGMRTERHTYDLYDIVPTMGEFLAKQAGLKAKAEAKAKAKVEAEVEAKAQHEKAVAEAEVNGLPPVDPVRIWHRSGATDAGKGWVIGPDGVDRECDRVDTMVCNSNSKKFRQNYEGDHVWDQILPGEVVLRWAHAYTAAEHEFEVIYRPETLTPAQEERIAEIERGIEDQFFGKSGLTGASSCPSIGDGWGLVERHAPDQGETAMAAALKKAGLA
ncbi:MAG: hypothetical protein LBK50_00985 [Candidatus Nomurabacteria bacterium]|jgi:hypothetical protein|nr:hypothetical protein [Candidatus Nomurabacteria bacterium]